MVTGKLDEAEQLDEESAFGPPQLLMTDVIVRLHDPAHIPVFLHVQLVFFSDLKPRLSSCSSRLLLSCQTACC